MSQHTVKDSFYVKVFVALIVLTAATVGASYVVLGHIGNMLLGLAIAIVKASLVALFFMHLISEKKIIFLILLLTALFVSGLFFITPLTEVWLRPHYVP